MIWDDVGWIWSDDFAFQETRGSGHVESAAAARFRCGPRLGPDACDLM